MNLLMRTTLKKFSKECVFSEENFFQISVKQNISSAHTRNYGGTIAHYVIMMHDFNFIMYVNSYSV